MPRHAFTSRRLGHGLEERVNALLPDVILDLRDVVLAWQYLQLGDVSPDTLNGSWRAA
jgi:hypothetical protein